MPNIVKDMTVTEVSAVDEGACRQDGKPLATTVLVKREVAKEHKYGDANDPADADNSGIDFNTAYKAIEAKEYAADVLEEVQEASEALYRSIHSILDDETITDPEKAVKTTIEQFKAHMANLVPEEMEKALSKIAKAIAAGNAGKSETVNKGVIQMADDVKKALADKDAEIATLKDIMKGMFTADEADYLAKASDAEKEKFKGMSAEERKAAMERECGKMTKREELPEDVRKALDENEILKKRLDAIEAEREFEGFKKRAADVGLGEDFAKHLHVIAKASPEAAEAVEKLAKAAQAVEKASPLFKEVGSSATNENGSAQAGLVAKANEIAKAENVSFAKAYVKAAEQNPALYSASKSEGRA